MGRKKRTKGEDTSGEVPSQALPHGDEDSSGLNTDRPEAHANEGGPEYGAEKKEGAQGQVVAEKDELTREEIDEIRKKAAERDEFLKLLQRVQADFQNYQKRQQKEKEEWRKFLKAELIEHLLSPLDHLEMAQFAARGATDVERIREGIELVYGEFLRALEKSGVARIPAMNLPFDPSRHEAISIEESADLPDGTVIEETRAGYMLHDRVLRASRVKVSKRPAAPVSGIGGLEQGEGDRDAQDETTTVRREYKESGTPHDPDGPTGGEPA